MLGPITGADRFSIPRRANDLATSKAAPHNSITSEFQALVAGLCRRVTVTWVKTLMNHTLSITLNSTNQGSPCTCKIDMKPWQFWGKKGVKSLELDGERVEIYWDFRNSKFSTSPEPFSDYYVAVVSTEQLVLLLGDMKDDAYKTTKCRPSLVEACLLHKKENAHGKEMFCTRTRLHEMKKETDIVIENYLSGPGDPEMLISVDGILILRVGNLNWTFRGKESVLVYDKPMQIFWDVHDWMFSSSASGHGVFIFKPVGSASCARSDFCHFLYAWRSE